MSQMTDDCYSSIKQDDLKEMQRSSNLESDQDSATTCENSKEEMKDVFGTNDSSSSHDTKKGSIKKKLGNPNCMKRQQNPYNQDNYQVSLSESSSVCYGGLSSTFPSQQAVSLSTNHYQGANPNNAIHNVSYLSRVRVIKKNLVYVIGIAPQLANEQTLQSYQYFGQYGEIQKIVVNKNNIYNPKGPNGPSYSAYITYAEEKDASLSILGTENFKIFDRVIRASYGTTKYCSYFLKNQDCPNIPDCLYLHSYGKDDDYFSKDEMVSNKNIFIDQQRIAIKNIRKYIPDILVEYQQNKHLFEVQSHLFSLPNLSRILEKLKDYGAITVEQFMNCRETPLYVQVNQQVPGQYPYPSRVVNYGRGALTGEYSPPPNLGTNMSTGEYECNGLHNCNSYNVYHYHPQDTYIDPSSIYHQQQLHANMISGQQRVIFQNGIAYSPPQSISNERTYHPQANQTNHPNQVYPYNNNYYYPNQQYVNHIPHYPSNPQSNQFKRSYSEFGTPQYCYMMNNSQSIPSVSPFEINDSLQQPKQDQSVSFSQVSKNNSLKQELFYSEKKAQIPLSYYQNNQYEELNESNYFNDIHIQPDQQLKVKNYFNITHQESDANESIINVDQKTQDGLVITSPIVTKSTKSPHEKYEQNKKDQLNHIEKKTDINQMEYTEFIEEGYKQQINDHTDKQTLTQSQQCINNLSNNHKGIEHNVHEGQSNQSSLKQIRGEEEVEVVVFQPLHLTQKSSKVIENLITELSSKSELSSAKSSESLGNADQEENSKSRDSYTPSSKLLQLSQQQLSTQAALITKGDMMNNSQTKSDSANKIINPSYELIANFWEEQNSSGSHSNSAKANMSENQPPQEIQKEDAKQQQSDISESKESQSKQFYTYESDQSSFQELCSGFNTFVLTKYY